MYRAKYQEVQKIQIRMNPYLAIIKMHNLVFPYIQPTLVLITGSFILKLLSLFWFLVPYFLVLYNPQF
jgi:hypothetical protein